MKFMINILIIYLIYIVSLNNALDLRNDQNVAAQSLLNQLYGINEQNPCSNSAFNCVDGGNGYLILKDISTGTSQTAKTIDISFGIFTDLKSITIGENYFVSTNFWLDFNKLSKLELITINNVNNIIPSNIQLPSLLNDVIFKKLTVPIPDGFFSSGGLKNLNIEDASNGFKYPTTLSSCSPSLEFVYIPISYFSGPLPSNLNTCANLQYVYLIIMNDNSSPQYTNFAFPDLQSLQILDYAIYFRNSDQKKIQQWEYPESLKNLPQLNYLTIEGRGFTLPSNGQVLDLSKYDQGVTLDFTNVGFLDNCTTFGCIKFSINTQILKMDNIDFTNLQSIRIENNLLAQPLPTPATLQHSKVILFSLTNSQFNGAIPTTNNFYCKFNKNVLFIYSNQLSGSVSNCFKCMGPNGNGGRLLPNTFTDFSENSIPPNPCPTLSINTNIPPVKTNKVSFVTVTGVDFGWSFTASESNVTIDSIIPNTQIVLRIPQGQGTGNTFIANFGYNYQTPIKFTYSYEAPTIMGQYYYEMVGDDYLMVITGTGFSYVVPNIAIINSVPSTQTLAVTSTKNTSHDQFTFSSSAPYNNLDEGTIFYLTVKVGDQTSSNIPFYFYKPLSFTVKPFSSLGGTMTLQGTFKTSSPSLVNVKINGVDCSILFISPSIIMFTYLATIPGTYDMVLTYSGSYQYTTQVEFLAAPPPTLVNKLDWANGDSLVLFGNSFSYVSKNTIKINSEEFQETGTSSFDVRYDMIILPPTATPSIGDGEQFNVTITTVNQTSNKQTFYLIKPISINTKSLYTIGGEIDFSGTFSTSNKDLATLIIDGSAVTITSLSPNSISFKYPYKQAAGYYRLLLTIGSIEYTQSIEYVNAPPPSLLSKYYWTTLQNGDIVLTLYGNWFTYYNQNIITINGVDYNATAAISSTFSNAFSDKITLLNSIPTESLAIGSAFTVKVKVGSQSTDLVNFIFFRAVNINVLPLQSIGGIATFEGSFSISDKKNVFVTIDAIQCSVVSISPTSIKFQYPPKVAGIYKFTYFFGGFEMVTYVAYKSTPAPELVYKYEWKSVDKLSVTGKWFGYYVTNIIVLNNINYTVPIAFASPTLKDYDTLTMITSTPTNSLSLGQPFNVQVIVQDQSSNVVTFYYINSISMAVKDLNTTGGIISFSGSFGVSDKSIVSLSINGTGCTVNYISTTSITFRYPPLSEPGQYELLINIGGFENTTNVQYVVPPSPTILNKYKWSSDNSRLILTGNSFSYVNQNNILINGVNYEATLAIGSSTPGNDEISFSSENLKISEGDYFNVQIETGGLLSNIVEFNYIKQITMSTNDLYTLGGFGTLFSGSFGTSNKTIASLLINGLECQVIAITPTTIKFSYPPMSQGIQELLLNIGGLDYSTSVNFIQPPPPTLLNSYYWSSLDTIVFKGLLFDYYSPNSVDINGNEFISNVAKQVNGNDEITFSDNSPTTQLSVGNSFTVKVKAGGQFSNSITFTFLKSILISTTNLNTAGGDITFSGEYHVSDKSLVLLKIDNIICNIIEIKPNSITFTYPPKSDGTFNLLLNIGGYEVSTPVTYKTPSSSEDDMPSVSSKLFVPIIILKIIFLIVFLF